TNSPSVTVPIRMDEAQAQAIPVTVRASPDWLVTTADNRPPSPSRVTVPSTVTVPRTAGTARVPSPDETAVGAGDGSGSEVHPVAATTTSAPRAAQRRTLCP